MLNAAKKELDEVQSKYDIIQHKIDKKKAIIVLQNHIKTGKPIDKVKFTEKISNTKEKVGFGRGGSHEGHIRWVPLSEVYLREVNHFVPPRTLVEEIT